jgi:hypothetical protein
VLELELLRASQNERRVAVVAVVGDVDAAVTSHNTATVSVCGSSCHGTSKSRQSSSIVSADSRVHSIVK